MTAIATTIVKADSCPDLTINNTTTFPTGNTDRSHWVQNFNTFIKLSLVKPNGVTTLYSTTDAKNNIEPPSISLAMVIEMCLSGIFNAQFTQLPTPAETPTVGQTSTFNPGDNFYYNGVIYNTLLNCVIPQVGSTNAQLIALFLTQNRLVVITEDDIADKYKSEIDFRFLCGGISCLKQKLARVNCLIVNEPTRTDLCDNQDFQDILKFFYLTKITGDIPTNAKELQDEKDYYNFVNQSCCNCNSCSGCK